MTDKAEIWTLEATDPISLDDRLVRLIGIPFFGLVIPSAAGLIELSSASRLEIVGSYLYFILIAWIVWEGNRFLVLRYYPVIFKSESDLQRYTLFLGLNIFYTVPVAFALLYLWKWIDEAPAGHMVIAITVAIIVVCVIFVTNVYEKVLYAKHNEREQIRMEKLEKGKIQAELEALKNQIDPHFMFNALNSLSYLVKKDTVRAEDFIQSLAEVYRYILGSKEKDMVLLRDEIAFMQAYARLMSLRYEDAFMIDLKVDEIMLNQYLIPPVTLMVAVENAIKHNEVSSSHHLVLEVQLKDDAIVLRNRRMARKVPRISTRIGLENLNQRFQRLTGKAISYVSTPETFTLEMPLLKLRSV